MGLMYKSRDGVTIERPSDSELVARQKLVDILDAELGPSSPDTPLEFAKANLIRTLIGDNINASAFDRVFHRWKSESAERVIERGQAWEAMLRQIRRNADHLRNLPVAKPQD
jgi:hypothetical protein